MSEKPIMDWDSQDPSDPEGRVVWWDRLDGRYQVEVIRDGEFGTLLMYDHQDGDRQVVRDTVPLSYGAIFGPDVLDVQDWRDRAVQFAEGGR